MAVIDESARVKGWATLYLTHALPVVMNRKNFHYKRKPERTVKEGTVFLAEIARQLKVPLSERKKEDLVQALSDRMTSMPIEELPQEVVENLPSDSWTAIKAKDKRVQAELAQVTSGRTKEDLMMTFQNYPKSFLELVHHLREAYLFPSESKPMVWVGHDVNSILVLGRTNIVRSLNKRDTSNWVLPPEFFDAELQDNDALESGPHHIHATEKSALKRKKPPGFLSDVGGAAGGGGNVDARLVTAALAALGKQGKAASAETAEYWKQREEIERENAKRAKIDSEVHRFKILEQVLPTLDEETRKELQESLQSQKADFCRKLLGGSNKQDSSSLGNDDGSK